MNRTISLAMAMALSSVATWAGAETLHLSCRGLATELEATTSFGTARNSDGDIVSGNVTSYHQQRSPDRTLVEIDGTEGRIRVPTSIVPGLRSGGHDGWWALDQIAVTDTLITARFSMNFANKPKVKIDRRTGEIFIDALGRSGFEGDCETFDPTAAERKF